MNTNPNNANLMHTPEFRLAVIAIAVFALMSFLSPERFLSPQNLTSMAFQFPEFAILALAMTITMMTGGIDLSVVGIANFTAVIAATILTRFSGPEMSVSFALLWFGIAIIVSLAIGAICGYINGALGAYFGLPPILATVGSGLVFTGFAVAMTGGSAVMGFPDVVAWLGNERLFSIPVPLIVFAVMAIGLHIVLTRTSFGLKVTMYGANPLAALFAAIDINRMLLRVYIMSGGRRTGHHEPRQFRESRLRLQLSAVGGFDCGAGRRQSLWRLWPRGGRGAGRAVDAVPVQRPQHVAGIEFRP